MNKKKSFIFLYPIPQIIDHEIKNHGYGEEEKFREKYRFILNKCISERYRVKGFEINYAIFDDCAISEIINFCPVDRIFKVGIDFKTHVAQNLYSSQDYILKQLNGAKVLRIGGFHMWDCVEKLAKRACGKGLDVLVDEDLTESLPYRMKDPDFKTGEYPTYNARKFQGSMFGQFLDVRKKRPWLWQKY